jgi:hypothetical protein
MKIRKLILATLAAGSIGAAAIPASADSGIWVNEAPPAPRHEVVPAPRHGYVWEPGYHDYRHGHYVWVQGHWVKERHGMYYHPTRWVQREGRWTMEKGRWDRERYVENRDRDHDGVPNRADRDRDGDGVPNHADRAPDNPHRR